MHLFGDSSYIVHYLRCLGYDLSEVEQTGSNFGTEVKHETPYLSSVGSGTMVADGLSIINADFSSTSFRVSRASIGAAQLPREPHRLPRAGQDRRQLPARDEGRWSRSTARSAKAWACSGSPSFEIPRSVERDSQFDQLQHRRRAAPPAAPQEPAQRCAPWRLFLLVAVAATSSLLTVLALAAVDLYARSRAAGDRAALFVLSPAVHRVYFVLVERGRRGVPARCSRSSARSTTRLLAARALLEGARRAYLQLFDGTPFKNVVWRMLGVRIGQRVFDDGCYLTERTLVTIGDDCTLNAGSIDPVPLAGGRHLQVRPQHDRRRLHARGRRLRPLRRDDGRRRGARPRLLPDEGRGSPRRTRGGAATRPREMRARRRPAAAVPTTDARSDATDRGRSGGRVVQSAGRTDREYWRGARAGGCTAIPRWTLDRHAASAIPETPLPAEPLRRLADELAVPLQLGAAGRARQGARRAVRRARGRDRLRRRRRAATAAAAAG